MSKRKIVTSFIHPPIPIRTVDWCAWFDGEEEGGVVGYGATEADAIEDLLWEDGMADEADRERLQEIEDGSQFGMGA